MLATLRRIVFATILIVAFSTAVSAAKIGPTLESKLTGLPNSAGVGVVIISFNTASGLSANHLDVLRAVGINRAITLQQLGMVASVATAGQVRALANNNDVRSIWSNDQLFYSMNQARVLTGVDKLRVDPLFRIGGLPIGGQGNFSAVINDSELTEHIQTSIIQTTLFKTSRLSLMSAYFHRGHPHLPAPLERVLLRYWFSRTYRIRTVTSGTERTARGFWVELDKPQAAFMQASRPE